MSCQIKRTENENFYTFIILANDANFICEIANLDKFNAISIDFQASYPWGLLLHFPLLHFTPLQSCPCRIFHSRISVAPLNNIVTLKSGLEVTQSH